MVIGLAVLGAFFLCWIVKLLVEALIAFLQTPVPWIALALVGLGFAGYHAQRRFHAERVEKLFLDAVAAIRGPDPGLPELLALLERRAPDQADAFLLIAADAANQARPQDALVAFERALQHPTTIGALSGGLELRFPGLPMSVRLDARSSARAAWIRAHLLTLVGRARDALDLLRWNPVHNDVLGLCVLAGAQFAVGDSAGAASALRAAATASTHDVGLTQRLRYRLARLFEDGGAPTAALEEYEHLVREGAYADAATRLHALRAAETARLEAASAAEAARLEAARVVQAESDHRALVARDRERLQRALANMETAKGPAGRRAALQAGLAAIEQREVRERLKLEASKIEVEAVLDKVDGLKTPAAKRRHLMAALEALRSDDVPDELQAKQIRWLEQALADLPQVGEAGGK